MKTIANRLIVFAAGAIAFGTVAFGQTRMIAEIPFAFRTVSATLPAGNYEVRETTVGGAAHMVLFWNTATRKGALAGNPTYDIYGRSETGTVLQFACIEHRCSLKAIRSTNAALEYPTPRKTRDDDKRVAILSIALKPINSD